MGMHEDTLSLLSHITMVSHSNPLSHVTLQWAPFGKQCLKISGSQVTQESYGLSWTTFLLSCFRPPRSSPTQGSEWEARGSTGPRISSYGLKMRDAKSHLSTFTFIKRKKTWA